MIQNFKRAKVHLRLKDIESVSIPKQDLNKLIIHTKEGKKREIEIITGRPKTNSQFIQTMRLVLSQAQAI
jgi:hypothetical protein